MKRWVMHGISEEQIEVYRQTMQRRKAANAMALRQHVAEAHDVSERAAEWLKRTYDVASVWLFGSLARPEWFTMTSDIDLAIPCLPPADYLMAVALLQDISPKFKIDLVQLERIPERLKAVILAEGKLL